MLFRKNTCAWLLLLLISTCLPLWTQTGKTESIGALEDPAVSASVRQSLAATGYRITLDSSSSPIEIWFRKEVVALPKQTPSDGIYRLAESALIGVLHFAQAASDYRGQMVRAGFYSLRYELTPSDGNHLGVAPSRDFLLLVPVNADPGPEKLLKFDELVRLSRQASGMNHPAPLSLVAAEGNAKPFVSKDDEGHVIFSATIHLSSGAEMPIALVIKGMAPQ